MNQKTEIQRLGKKTVMKKILRYFTLTVLLFTLTLSVLSINVSAADSEATLAIDSSFARAGASFSVDVYITTNANLGVVNFTLQANEDLVMLIPDECVGHNGTIVNYQPDGVTTFVYYSQNYEDTGSSSDESKTIKLAKLVFKVNDTVQNGEYTDYLKLSGEIDSTDTQLNTVNMSFAAPTLTINERACGDIYNNQNDGKIDSKDAIYILQYLAKMVTIDESELYYANTYVGDDDEDGTPKINSKDAIIILQYLARMDVILGGTGSSSDQGLAHTHVAAIDAAMPATCTTTGLTEGSHCSVCGVVLNEQTVTPITDHSYINSVCEYCGVRSCISFKLLSDYMEKCTVTDNDNVVTMIYDTYAAAEINLDYFSLNDQKTYVFVFGPNSADARFIGGGIEYQNVRIEIQKRSTAFDLVLDNIRLTNKNSVISCHAETLNLTLTGANVTLKTSKGSNGTMGACYGYAQIGNGEPGTNGGNANAPITCDGVLEIYCDSNVLLCGGNGGDGGNGGYSNSSGSYGGVGGRGGDGAPAIVASTTNVYFLNGRTITDISIAGGAGGSGGTGGYGRSFAWIFGKTYAANGENGTNAPASERPIIYHE